ncbi:serine--tRNA ligase [Candidatus Bathyarchaeota archaeon]|nr:serine--tRNA ligase [Candidatus Bathyarchaeota archaeon]
MLDIKLIRERPTFVKNNLSRRGNPEFIEMLDKLIALDKKWRLDLTELNKLRHKRKKATNEIASLKKINKDISNSIKKAKNLDGLIENLEKEVVVEKKKIKEYLLKIPNLLHETVPIGLDENKNVQLKKWGEIPNFDYAIKNHIELGTKLQIIDIKRAGKVAGSRFFYLKGSGVLLDLALINFAIKEMTNKGFELVEPPYLMRREAYQGATALADFEDVLYKIENENLYLIATSEHPLVAMFMKEVIEEKNLPLKIAGISPCFRKEAGSHGKDTRGIFRTHQFNKIEQFIFCTPEQSWLLHEELLSNAEDIMKKIGLPYRVVNVCTGDIGTVAAKKFDIEVWMPAQNAYREIVSCSNCTEYQSRRLDIRYREKEGAPVKGFVHTLNSTAIATGRMIVAILENFQQEDGSIIIPEVLREYMGNIKKINL